MIIFAVFLIATIALAAPSHAQNPQIVTNCHLNAEQWDAVSGAEREHIEEALKNAGVWGNNVRIIGDLLISPYPEDLNSFNIVEFFQDTARTGCRLAFDMDKCNYGQGIYSRGARLNDQICVCRDDTCGWE